MANSVRNARAEVGRHRRWAPARDALWDVVGPHLVDGARVAVLGAGNGDDLPLRRIAARAGSVTLIDIDPRAARAARRRLPWRLRRRVEVIEHDVTGGAADRIVLAAARGEAPGEVIAGGSPTALAAVRGEPPGRLTAGGPPIAVAATEGEAGEPTAPEVPLPGAPYDLAIGDLLYSQLLYPALLDLGVDEERRADCLRRYAPSLTRATVARLHASAPTVVHVHDPLAWWDGHEQPVALDQVLRLSEEEGIEAALDAVARGIGPTESDPRAALRSLGIAPRATALYGWPFSPGVDYLACATIAGE